MAKLLQTSFTKYELNSEEYLQSTLLTDIQRMGLQNLLADIAEEKLALTYDATNSLKFAQQEADLTGKKDILTYILELDITARGEMQRRNSPIA